jgi:hypothetical protein
VSGSFAGDAVEGIKGLEDLRKLAYHLDHLKESAGGYKIKGIDDIKDRCRFLC